MVLYSTRIKTALRNASLVIRMRRTLPDGIHLVGQATLQRGLYYILVWIWARNLADSQCVLPRQLETGPLASEVRELLSQVPATKFGQQLWLRHSVRSRQRDSDGGSDVGSDASSAQPQPQPKRQLFSLIFRYLIHDRRRIGGRLFSHLLASSMPASNAVCKLVLLMPTPVPVPAPDPCCARTTLPSPPNALVKTHNSNTHVDPDAGQLGY